MELLAQFGDGEGDSEEVESVPRPGEESDEEEHPLLEIQECEQFEGIWCLVHGWFEGGDARRNVSSHAHVLLSGDVGVGGVIA